MMIPANPINAAILSCQSLAIVAASFQITYGDSHPKTTTIGGAFPSGIIPLIG